MGFVDYKGDKNDNYSDVVNFARKQQKIEQSNIDFEAKSKWIAERLNDKRYSGLGIEDILKMLIYKYKNAKESWQLLDKSVVSAYVDCEQLIKDLWLYCVIEQMIIFDVDETNKNKYLQIFINKIFHFDNIVSDDILRYINTSPRYCQYLLDCFDFSKEKMEFWKMLGSVRTTSNKDTLQKFFVAYHDFYYLLGYYLYLGLKPGSDTWMNIVDRNIRNLKNITACYGVRMLFANYEVMNNPFYGRFATSKKNISSRCRCLLFNYFNNEKDDSMFVEELYMKINDGKVPDSQVDSILPVDVINKLRGEVLTEFAPTFHLGLKEGEKLYYMNNAIFYYGTEADGEVSFSTWAGKLCITDRRLFFDSEAKVSVAYDKMYKVVLYDALPNILQIDLPENKTAFFKVSDGDTAYKCLRLVADARMKKKVNVAKVNINVNAIIEKEDLETYAFAFDYMRGANMSDEMRKSLSSLSLKIKGLKRTIDDYPDAKSDILPFYSIYLPNALKFVAEYIGYNGAPLDSKLIMDLETKVQESISSLDAAIETKISQVYGLATLDTMAQADGLRNLLGLKGYVNTKPII